MSSSPTVRRTAYLSTLGLAAAALAGMTTAGPSAADHGSFPATTGIYRIAYADGVDMTVSRDNHNHGGDGGNRNRVDLTGDDDDQEIVAAASGWVRAVVDNHGNDPGAGDNVGDDPLEHSCQDDTYEEGDVIPPGSDVGDRIPDSVVPGLCQDYNNYVWIEHPNGEWTKYTHFGTGTVSSLGWAPGMWVDAGDVLGTEGDVGSATGPHLHHEAAVPNTPPLTWSTAGGFFSGGQNLAIRVCDIAGSDPEGGDLYFSGDSFEAAPCDHQAPTADAGESQSVDEGGSVVLDGSASSDPEGSPLTYAWRDSADLDDSQVTAVLDDPRIAAPTFAGIDDGTTDLTLFVYDQVEQLQDNDTVTVTVLNVAPSVTAVGDHIVEGGTATVSATFDDPGAEDTHTATIDWGDGSPVTAVVPLGSLGTGIDHVYGDNGTYAVTVTVSDDDGGVGQDVVDVVVDNLDPTVDLDTSGVVSFPGGDYEVVEQGADLPASAEGSDPGSDDLTFTWSTGDAATYFNNGVDGDPFPSPAGNFPFFAADSTTEVFESPGAETLGVELSDDDGGTDAAESGVLVTGGEDDTRGDGWWKHQYGGMGSPQLDDATLTGYLEVVTAASSVFGEQTSVDTVADAHQVLSPTGDDQRARAEAALLAAWLQFASGAVDHDATVPLPDSQTVGFLPLMAAYETVVLDGAATDAELLTLTQDLSRVRHAS